LAPLEALGIAENRCRQRHRAVNAHQRQIGIGVIPNDACIDNTARQRYVTLGQLIGDLRVIKDGLAADDRVIVNGLMLARPGDKVAPEEEVPKQAPAPQANASPAKTD
jgi:multidrug efflux pump subunit AcrA (membrane-fusion protein)